MTDHSDMEYVDDFPAEPLPDGRVLVHNHVVPAWPFGTNGFRVWTEAYDPRRLVGCPCDVAGYAPADLVHYRIAAKGPVVTLPGRPA